MKCLKCNEKEALTGREIYCEECKKKQEDEWNTCKFCGCKDSSDNSNYVIMSECSKCRRKRENEHDFKEAQKEGKITRDDSIMCPYCGFIDEETFECHNNRSYDCPECEKESELSIEYTTHFTTVKKEKDGE